MSAAFGTQVRVYHKGQFQQQTFYPVKGYMSSMHPILHFGLGNANQVDSLVVNWPDGMKSTSKNVAVNQRVTLSKRVLKRKGGTERTSSSLYCVK